MKIIGIDNGSTGSIGIVDTDSQEVSLCHTPVKKQLNYTKMKQWLNRVDGRKLFESLQPYKEEGAFIYFERPMVNPQRWKASTSALRALEATLIVIELVKIPFQYIDSKEWQRVLLPKGLQKDELKPASLDLGKRLFPNVSFKGFEDADGLLIAEYGRRVQRERE